MLHDLQRGDPRSIGPYQLVGQLGSGGMGRVFLGRSLGGRLVAVKVIRSDLAAEPDFRMRFRREVSAARRVSGLYTAIVVDADPDAEEPWLATAYVAGPSLTEAVYDHGPLPPRSALALAAGLAESLAAIHKVGVVHRDLKPSNVLLAEDGPRLIDFGISRAAESTSVTRAGFVIGSPGFMSPEQAQGGEVGPPSDMFSLGAVLVFAATGEPPFGSGSTAALVFRVVFGQPQLDAVPDEIRAVVERCLAKDPSQRPSANELLTEIGAMQPETGWLPGPVTSTFQVSQAPFTAPPPAPPPTPAPPPLPQPAPSPQPPAVEAAAQVEAEEPSAAPPDHSRTVTGFAPFVPAEPEVVTPAAEAVTPVTEAVTPVAEAVTPAAGTVPPAAGTVPPAAGTVPPAAGTVPPEAGTVPPEPVTAPPVFGTFKPEAVTRPAPGGPVVPAPWPGPGPEQPTAPKPAREPELAPAREPEPAPAGDVLPLPWIDGQGPRRPRSRRPVVLGAVAAAVILIAAGGTALALSGSGHPSALPPTTSPATATSPVVTASTQSSTAQPTPTAAATSHRPTTSPSTHRPTTQPAAQPTTPAPVTHSATPRPTPRPTHRATHTAPPPTTFSFSVSGASELGCGVIGSVQSSSGASVGFSFSNNSSGTVQVDEIGTNGSVFNDATLSPGQQFSGAAFVGLYYEVAKSNGSCLAVFHVTSGGGVTIH